MVSCPQISGEAVSQSVRHLFVLTVKAKTFVFQFTPNNSYLNTLETKPLTFGVGKIKTKLVLSHKPGVAGAVL